MYSEMRFEKRIAASATVAVVDVIRVFQEIADGN